MQLFRAPPTTHSARQDMAKSRSARKGRRSSSTQSRSGRSGRSATGASARNARGASARNSAGRTSGRQSAGSRSARGSRGRNGSGRDDAIALLKADHREVERMFSEFEGARSEDRKGELAARICTALQIHAAIEEAIFYPAFLE